MKPTYSPEQRAAAVALFAEHGLAYAFHHTGITKTSIARWAKAAGIVTTHLEKTEAATAAREVRIAAKRAALKERLLDEAAYCIDAIHNEHIDFKSAGPLGPVKVVFPVAPAAAVQHYATSLAIFLDKFRLENGEVTGREELKHGFDLGHLTDSELESRIIAEAEGITRGAS